MWSTGVGAAKSNFLRYVIFRIFSIFKTRVSYWLSRVYFIDVDTDNFQTSYHGPPSWIYIRFKSHYSDAIMRAMVSQITAVSIVYFTGRSGADRSKHQSFASLTGEFPAQRASNAEIVPIWWRHLAKVNIISNSVSGLALILLVVFGAINEPFVTFLVVQFLFFADFSSVYSCCVAYYRWFFFNDWSYRIAILYEIIYTIFHGGDHDYSLTQCQSNHMENSVILIY